MFNKPGLCYCKEMVILLNKKEKKMFNGNAGFYVVINENVTEFFAQKWDDFPLFKE